MNDAPIRSHIEALVAEEHRLLEHGDRRSMAPADLARLEAVEIELDQYWDLLRQRRARRDAGQDPGAAQLRDAQTVEHYQQ